MSITDSWFWWCIGMGNVCFILMLCGVRKLVQKSSLKEGQGILLLSIGLFIGFVLFNPLGRELQLLGKIGDGKLSSLILGAVYAVFFMFFMPCCHFFLFKLKLYCMKKDRWSVYIYHDRMLLFIYGLGCLGIWGPMAIAAVINNRFVETAEIVLGILLIVNYLGATVLAFLVGQVFVMTNQGYCYYSLKKKQEGRLEDIESAELKDKAVILGIKGEDLPVWCTSEPYSNLLCEQCKKRIKDRHHGEKGYEAI